MERVREIEVRAPIVSYGGRPCPERVRRTSKRINHCVILLSNGGGGKLRSRGKATRVA